MADGPQAGERRAVALREPGGGGAFSIVYHCDDYDY